VVDFPNSKKAKKLFLVLEAGGNLANSDIQAIKGREEEADELPKQVGVVNK